MLVECIKKGNGFESGLPDPIVGNIYEVVDIKIKDGTWYLLNNSIYLYSISLFKVIKNEYKIERKSKAFRGRSH